MLEDISFANIGYSYVNGIVRETYDCAQIIAKMVILGKSFEEAEELLNKKIEETTDASFILLRKDFRS